MLHTRSTRACSQDDSEWLGVASSVFGVGWAICRELRLAIEELNMWTGKFVG